MYMYMYMYMYICVYVSFLSSSLGRESACNVGDLGGWEDPLEEGMAGNPLKYSCLENHCGQRSLAGCSPWGSKELDMTE